LDKTLIILGETLISLERGNPKSKVIYFIILDYKKIIKMEGEKLRDA